MGIRSTTLSNYRLILDNISLSNTGVADDWKAAPSPPPPATGLPPSAVRNVDSVAIDSQGPPVAALPVLAGGLSLRYSYVRNGEIRAGPSPLLHQPSSSPTNRKLIVFN